MRTLLHELRLFLVALQFLSRVPVPRRLPFEPDWLNASARHFPLVGAVVGALGAAVLVAAQYAWTPLVAAALAVASTVWLTAAFHEDGLSDSFDALLGAAPRERALAIMKDSRIGSYGAVVLVLVLVLRIAALAALLQAQGALVAASGLVASHMLARAGAVALMTLLPYAGDEAHAKAKPLARAVAPRDAACAAGTCLLLAALPLPHGPLAVSAMVVAALVWILRGWLFMRLGGYTGDTLGAAEQLCEVAVLLALAARW